MDSNDAAVLCPVCFELYNDPRNLPCGHSFCFKCISQFAGHRQHFYCPTCRAEVKLDSQGVNRLPKNYILASITEQKLLSAQCSEHAKPLDIFCAQCDVMVCLKCLVRSHSGHHILETEEVLNIRKGRLKELLESTKSWQAEIKQRTNSLRLSQQEVQKDADRISAEVDEKFRKWSDELEQQRQIVQQHVSDIKQQRMNSFDLYLTVLDGVNTEISNIQTEMNATMSKDTMSVMQLCRSMEISHEKVGRKTEEVMADCFNLPGRFDIDIHVLLMEEAIQNIKSYIKSHVLDQWKIEPCRPTKLSDMFCELYDNERTDAFEKLEKHLGDQEKEIISYLMEFLLEINSVCKDIYSSKLKTIEEAFVKASVPSDKTKAPSEIRKRIKEELKSMAPRLLQQIREPVLESLKAKFSAIPVAGCLQFRSIQQYIIKCTEVCWYMSAQDPQIFMDGSKSPDGKFDRDKYKYYTRKGPYVDYVVWPALYLYQGGQMLCRGVAQGTMERSKKTVTYATMSKNS